MSSACIEKCKQFVGSALHLDELHKVYNMTLCEMKIGCVIGNAFGGVYYGEQRHLARQ